MTEINEPNESRIQEETVSSLSEDVDLKSQKTVDENQNGESGTDDQKEAASDETVKVETSENGGETQSNGLDHKDGEDEEAKAVSSTDGEKMKQNENPEAGEEKKKEENQAIKKKDESLGSAVAKHYNEIPAGSRETRKDSRIFHLRNFNNWIKSVIINEYLDKIKRRKRTSDDINVLDLGCGKGGDLLKWDKGRVDHVIMADIAATSVDQCKERYSKLERDRRRGSHSRVFSTEFFAADCTKEVISEKYKKKEIKLDLTSCQFAFHYSFESYDQADIMLRNACQNLRVGGYFIGTTADSNKLVKRIKECKEADSFGNSVFNIKSNHRDNFPLFGSKYTFFLEGVVDCPEFLVHFPTMEALAAKYNMKLVWKKNFHEIFKEHERQHSTLLNKMNALETYPAPANKTLLGGSESQYKSACDYLERKSCSQVGTLSADEWEVAGLYVAFAFEKMEEKSASTSHDSRKRGRDHSSDKRRSVSSSSSKRSRKESATEEVYEVKDEIYEVKDEIYDAEADVATTTTTSNDSKTEEKKEEAAMETETKQEETVVKETTEQPMESADSTQEAAETAE
ncbi:mRNA cap guanine-N7 methyltransferase-like [Clytia hemisphaerica]|uniref:mRNA (guanine-N(7))-methyltransferase n=1 Tax=Clytia hemisphaerica TaxID=252671 RepID=A0A7M5WJ19_9CNID